MKGKNYANRKPVEERPESDNYPTPIPLIYELVKLGIIPDVKLHDPCAGDRQLVNTLRGFGYDCTGSDIRDKPSVDFLEDFTERECVVTNAPFSCFDSIISHAKDISPVVISIGKTNFFGAHSRNTEGLWKNLKHVYAFDRQIEYRGPLGEENCHVGMIVTGWFVWDRSWNKRYWNMSVIDVNKYCTLGPLEKRPSEKKSVDSEKV